MQLFILAILVAVRQLFEEADFYEKVPKSNMFVSVNDAVSYAMFENQLRQNKANDGEDVTIAEHTPPKTSRVRTTNAQRRNISPTSQSTALET